MLGISHMTLCRHPGTGRPAAGCGQAASQQGDPVTRTRRLSLPKIPSVNQNSYQIGTRCGRCEILIWPETFNW